MRTYADNRTPRVRLIRIKGLPDPLLEHYRERPNQIRSHDDYNAVNAAWLSVASTFCNKSRT